MSEGFREWGDYGIEEEWKNRSPIKKALSFRTFKRFVKIFCIAIICAIYGIIAYRLITGLGVPDAAKKMLWTDEARAAYEKNGGNLVVYAQQPTATFADDGRFSIYSVKYIPETSELQLSIRYNHSTVSALKDEIAASFALDENASSEETAAAEAARSAALEEVDDFPFSFILREGKYDEATGTATGGNIYADYSYSAFDKGLYTYVTLSYGGVELFSSDTAPAEGGYFSPDEKYSDIIYKGRSANTTVSDNISYLYIDFYYENDVNYNDESWADPLLVYDYRLTISEYDVSKDAPSNTKQQIIYVKATEND